MVVLSNFVIVFYQEHGLDGIVLEIWSQLSGHHKRYVWYYNNTQIEFGLLV